jgi:hypothetical protein
MILKMNHQKLSKKEKNTTNPVQSKTFKTLDMKKFIIISASLLLTAVAYCFFAKQSTTTETAVNKNINFEVYKTASYISPVYENSTATLEVTVVRVKGNKRDTAFQHTFQPKQLKDYPGSDKPMVQEITIPNVNDRKEKLEVYYKLTYDSKGSVIHFLNTETIGKGQQAGSLQIQI